MILAVHTLGSAPPSAIALAADKFGGVVFVVDPADPQSEAMLTVLWGFGEVLVANDAQTVIRHLGSATPNGVVTFAESTLPLAAAVARFLGLSAPSETSVEWLTNKAAQRQRLNECSVGHVRSKPMTNGHVPDDAPMPAVVKPQVGAGSEDTVFVRNAEDLAQAAALMPASRDYVIEELLEGAREPLGPWLADYVSVESALAAGKISHLGISGRLPLAPHARETGLIFPISMPLELGEDVLELTESAITALGIESGLVHTEVKLTPSGPAIIEVNGRLGGGLWRLMPRTGAADPVGLAIALAAGEPMPATFDLLEGHALHFYVQPPMTATVVRDLPLPAQIRKLPGVFGADRIVRPGSPVDWRRGSSSRVYDIWVEGTTMAVLQERLAAVSDLLDESITWEHR